MRIRYGYDTDAMRHDTIYDVRYGYDAKRYDTLVRDNDGSPSPDRVREPIKFYIKMGHPRPPPKGAGVPWV